MRFLFYKIEKPYCTDLFLISENYQTHKDSFFIETLFHDPNSRRHYLSNETKNLIKISKLKISCNIHINALYIRSHFNIDFNNVECEMNWELMCKCHPRQRERNLHIFNSNILLSRAFSIHLYMYIFFSKAVRKNSNGEKEDKN